jgi:hypothetical protein
VPQFPSNPYRKISRYSPKLVESYCPGCELLIAASPSRRILTIMETLHECPVQYRYPQQERRTRNNQKAMAKAGGSELEG